MQEWRRRLACGVALFFIPWVTSARSEIRVALVDGQIEIAGLTTEAMDAMEAGATRVRVSVGPDAPAILGEYRVAGGRLYFQPMFPFDPGREYIVRVDGGGEPFFATVALPARDLVPTTIVEHIYPSTDTLPENQLKFYIHFSAPMAGGDGLVFVKLLDDNGEQVIDPFLPLGNAFWGRNHRRYTVFFDPGRVKRGILPNEEMGRPILEGRRYVLVVDPTWRDAEGQPLAEPFRKEFIAGPPDETPIDPKMWTLISPRAETREPLTVDFPEPLDRAVLARTLAVENVDGEIEISRDETRWSLIPEKPWQAGTYHLIALTILEDLAGNQIGKPFEVDVFTRVDSPDDVTDTHRVPFVVRD
ncbi:MAG: hypothetical protein E2P02_27095 [Acidobacteria bacterium]|nr:MAG: hypothetical protein E2P02_27095 [Acidobacteriota bacterium]